MPTLPGEGKHGEESERILKRTDASLCIVVIIKNDRAEFDIAMTDPTDLLGLIAAFHGMADELERSLASAARASDSSKN